MTGLTILMLLAAVCTLVRSEHSRVLLETLRVLHVSCVAYVLLGISLFCHTLFILGEWAGAVWTPAQWENLLIVDKVFLAIVLFQYLWWVTASTEAREEEITAWQQ